MAADRDNPKVSHLCQPLSPAVLQVLRRVIRACRRVNKPLTLCGEMAASPRAFVLLFGMGLRNFSMSPAFIPSIKELAAHVNLPEAQRVLRKALRLTTTSKVSKYLEKELKRLAPNLSLLDMA
jgi:phosphotransferase system enzyme I (PtsI)